jgi:hypothetical protein
MEPVVIDNFLPPRYFSRIKEIIESKQFLWSFSRDITFSEDATSPLYSYGFQYFTVDDYTPSNCQTFQILTAFYCNLLDATECNAIIKSRVDMVTYSPEKFQHTIHVDMYVPHIASVFYITDSDAETILYNRQCFSYNEYCNNVDFDKLEVIKEIEPKQNRLLIFDGSFLHTGRSPSKYKNRIIINTDLAR